MPTVSNISPPNLAELERFTPVTFDLSALGSLFIIRAELPQDRSVLVYDGSQFVPPFTARSTAVWDGSILAVSVTPDAGWVEGVSAITIEPGDEEAMISLGTREATLGGGALSKLEWDPVDGNLDGIYLIDFNLISLDSTTIDLRLNDDVVTARDSERATSNSASQAYADRLVVADPFPGAGVDDDTHEGHLRINAPATLAGVGKFRRYTVAMAWRDEDLNNLRPRFAAGEWRDSSTNIIKIGLYVNDDTAKIAEGSWATLFKIG